MTPEELQQVNEVATYLACLEACLSELTEEQIDVLIENDLLDKSVKAYITRQYSKIVQ